MSRPNFFIVGAPKCGTTALFEYLRGHPDIFVPDSSRKESHYFADDLPGLQRYGPGGDYFGLFSRAEPHHLRIGEASVYYLYSAVALKRLREYDPEARIIAMFRNPVEAVYSYHSQLLHSLNEDVHDFEEAWRLQSDRQQGRGVPRTCLEPSILQYQDVFRFGSQCERLLSYFPTDQVKIVLFDEFVSSTRRVYGEILEFLGVPDDQRASFPRINENSQLKSRMFHQMLTRPPRHAVTAIYALRRMFGVEEFGVSRVLRRMNDRKAERAPMRKEMRAELAATFSEDVKLLSRIVGQDLTHWSSL